MKSLSELQNLTLNDDAFKGPVSLPDKTEVIAQVKSYQEKSVTRGDGSTTNITVFTVQVVEVLDGPTPISDLKKFKTLYDHEIWEESHFAKFCKSCGVSGDTPALEAAAQTVGSRFRAMLQVKESDKGFSRVKFLGITAA